VIDKAAGLLTVPTTSGEGESVLGLLEAYLGARPGDPRVHVVQRLDRAASGVLVLAKNADMRARLQALFAAHDVERVYVAIVHGRLAPPAGTLRSRLAEDESLYVRSVAAGREGKEAITHYRTLEAGERYSRLELVLETGRRHQIRVHVRSRS
jgi:23S rRNA pseudouridine1911/1915/1917 synthase